MVNTNVKKKSNKLTARINDVSKIFNDELNEKCFKEGISPATRRIMFYLSGTRDVNQLYIVKQTRLKAPTISVALSRLEEKGIITRRANEYDLRNMLVSLTDLGEEMDAKIVAFSNEIDEHMMRGISDDEIKACLKVLDKLEANMEDFGD